MVTHSYASDTKAARPCGCAVYPNGTIVHRMDTEKGGVARNPYREAFAAELRAARARRGYTQQELADRAGLSRVTVARLETSQRDVLMAQLLALCNALNVNAGEFLNAVQRQAAGE